jgi:hypothetical protein
MIHGNLILLCPFLFFVNDAPSAQPSRRKLMENSSRCRVCVPDTEAFYAQAVRARAISVIPHETLLTETAAPRPSRCGNT